jgi:hypothetical protein
LNDLGRWRDREGKRRGEGGGGPAAGVPHCAGVVMGPGPDWHAAPGNGPRPVGVRDVRRAVVAGRVEERRWG